MIKSKETKTEFLTRRYLSALKALSDFQTDVAYFHTSNSPIDYGSICKQIDQLKTGFNENVYYVLPSARIRVAHLE